MKNIYQIGETSHFGEIPPKMYASAIQPDRYGPPEKAFRTEVVDTPVPGPGRALIHTMAGATAGSRNPVLDPLGTEEALAALDVVLARDSHPLTTTLDPRYLRTDDAVGWDEHAAGLEVVRVPGDHVSMIDPPHVAVLASALAERLAAPAEEGVR